MSKYARRALIFLVAQWFQFLLYELPNLHEALPWQPWRMVMATADAYLCICSVVYVFHWVLEGAGVYVADRAESFATFPILSVGVCSLPSDLASRLPLCISNQGLRVFLCRTVP